MASMKSITLSRKTANIFSCLRSRNLSTELDNQELPKESVPASEVGSEDTPTPQKFEIVNPIKMAYTEYKSSEITENAPPLIILHGLLGSRTNWKSLARAIHAETKLKVYTVDVRNHGDSEHSAEMTYAHMAEDVRRFMYDLEIPSAALMGHSMGGRAVMTVALKYPSLVSQMVVVDMSPVIVSPTIHLLPRYFDAMDAVTLTADMSVAEARAAADSQMRVVIKDKGVRQFILTNLVKLDGKYKWRVNLGGVARNFTQFAIFPAGEEGLTYEGPTLFVGGGYSDHIPVDSHEETRELFPTAKFVTIPKAGHWVHAEMPNEFLNVVTPFLTPKKRAT